MVRKTTKDEVRKMRNALPPLSDAQLHWMQSRMESYMRNAYLKQEAKKKIDLAQYYLVVTTYKGWQVLRNYQVRAEYSKRIGFRLSYVAETAQRWIKGNEWKIYQRPKLMCWWNTIQEYNLTKPFCEVAGSASCRRNVDSYCYDTENVYPRMRITEQFKRIPQALWNVDILFLKEFFKRASPSHFTHIETLFKMHDETADEIAHKILASEYDAQDNKADNLYYRPYLITKRHHYKIADSETWCDHIKLLEANNLDTHNPHYICPQDLEQAHRHLNEIDRRRRDAERIKEEKEEARNYEATYKKKMSKYFDLCFTQGGITIKPLMSVKDFVDEGESMHHCVFKCGYYKKKDTLILSARDNNGERIETIEVDTQKLKIIQSRGLMNETTDKHDAIVSLVNANMNKIRAVA